MYNFSKFCRIMQKLIKEYLNEKEDDKLEDIIKDKLKDIINLSYFLSISKSKEIKIEEHFINKFLRNFNDFNKKESFFFKDSSELKSIMTLFNICHLTQTHICIEGKSGIGKTSCAKAFAEILNEQEFVNYRLFSFNNNTTANDIFGSLTLDENKNISYCNGTLTDSIKYGNIFIAY